MALLDDQAQVVFEFRTANDPDPFLCTLGVDKTEALAYPPVQLAEDMAIAFDAEVLPQLSQDLALRLVRVQIGTSGGIIEASFPWANNGSETGDMLTQNTAFLVHKQTAAVGRGKSGRMYIPGVPEVSVDQAGIVSSGKVSDMDAALAEWFQAITNMISESPVVNHGPGSALGSSTLITAFTCDALVATQRRRLRH